MGTGSPNLIFVAIINIASFHIRVCKGSSRVTVYWSPDNAIDNAKSTLAIFSPQTLQK